MVWQMSADHGSTVVIAQNGSTIHTIDLSRVEEPYTITIDWEDGYNIVEVTPQTVCVIEATCDNQICVEHGPLLKHGSPITCLPHRLTVSWAESRVDA